MVLMRYAKLLHSLLSLFLSRVTHLLGNPVPGPASLHDVVVPTGFPGNRTNCIARVNPISTFSSESILA